MLTDTQIRNLKPAEKAKKYADGGGLYLYVAKTGSKLWRMAYRFNDKEKLINGMKSSGKKRDNSGSIGRLLGGMCNSIAEYATKKEGIQPSFFAVVSLTLVNPF